MASVVTDTPIRQDDMMRDRAHPYLSGIHKPMPDELTLTELEVHGTIPVALNGRYLRIGPNPVAPDPASYHWFTGDGMVHGLQLGGGKAHWYRNRWIASTHAAQARGTQPAPGPRHGPGDTVNTNVVALGDGVYALVEGGSTPVRLSATLDRQRYDDLGGTLAGAFTAHPHRDPLTGEHHGICYAGRRPTEIHHVVVSPDGRVSSDTPITVVHGPMIHDCAITARYVLILDLPVTFSMAAAMAGQSLPYAWNPAQPARVGLMPRDGTQEDIVWCAVAPGFVFHVANAFDLPNGKVALDVCAYPTMFAVETGGPDAPSRGLERWTLDPATATTTIATIDPAPQDFPRIDERLFGQPYRYAFTMATRDDRRFESADRLYKHDMTTGEREVHSFGRDRHPGEFVFVPASPHAAEGRGWLIGFVIDAATDTTDFVIIDATRFTHPPVAVVRLPHRIPPGFHGNWIEALSA